MAVHEKATQYNATLPRPQCKHITWSVSNPSPRPSLRQPQDSQIRPRLAHARPPSLHTSLSSVSSPQGTCLDGTAERTTIQRCKDSVVMATSRSTQPMLAPCCHVSAVDIQPKAARTSATSPLRLLARLSADDQPSQRRRAGAGHVRRRRGRGNWRRRPNCTRCRASGTSSRWRSAGCSTARSAS